MPYHAIFQHDPIARGTPDAPTPLGFLNLAQAGRDVWNAWRAAYPTIWDAGTQTWLRAVKWKIPLQGLGVVLDNYPNLSFSGFEFGDGAEFSEQSFSHAGLARFDDARFGEGTRFFRVNFRVGATFREARFGNNTRFAEVVWMSQGLQPVNGDWANFEGACFGNGLVLSQTIFQHPIEAMPVVSFKNCSFGNEAQIHLLSQAGFRDLRFDGSIFGDNADFSRSHLYKFVSFRSCSFGRSASFNGTRFREADFSNCRFDIDADFRGEEFGAISFVGTIFQGRSDFGNREFTARTDFGSARFGAVPLFHNCKLHEDTNFDYDSFPKGPEGTGDASRAYRTLKLAMSKHQATREEQFFFRHEMREERVVFWRAGGIQRKLRSILYALYGGLSDYGTSVRRPAVGFVALLLTFAGLYALLSGGTLWIPGRTFSGEETLRWLTYSVVNSLPLGGLDDVVRELRKGVAPPTLWLGIALVIHKVISLLFLFLIGLALRNLFKMK